MIGASSDWHLGGGGLADDSNRAGLFWLHEQFFDCGVLTGVAVLGDSGEGLQFATDQIVKWHRPFLRWLDQELYRRNLPFYLIDGNHDPAGWPQALRGVMTRCDFRAMGQSAEIDGWRLVHGNEWDVWNRFGSPLKPIANAVTRIAGWLERAIPGFDENRWNPRRMISPSKATRESLHGTIREAADEWAEAHAMRVCYGHTHRQRLSASGRVANTGCVVNGHAEGAMLWPDRAVLLRKGHA